MTDNAKTGEFKWRLGEDVKASTATTTTTTTTMMPAAVLTEQAATTMPWPSVEVGPGDAYCGTMDANTTLRGVDCALGKTDTVVRTILCEAGEDTNENRMNQVSLDCQASFARKFEFHLKAVSAWATIKVNIVYHSIKWTRPKSLVLLLIFIKKELINKRLSLLIFLP